MSESSDQERLATFVIELFGESEESSLVRFVFDDLDDGEGGESVEIDISNEEKPDPDESFRKLCVELTGSFLAFFELVPSFTQNNFQSVSSGERSKLESDFSKLAILREDEEGEAGIITRFTLPFEVLPFAAKSIGRTTQSFLAVRSMAQSALSALIAEYEVKFRDLLRILAAINLEAFVSGGESITLDQVAQYKNHDDLISALVEKKIDEIMYKSHAEQLQWVESKFGVNLTSNTTLVNEFIEVCQRRHLIIHNGGRVNEKYIDECSELGLLAKDLPDLGDEVEVSRKYLRRATARSYQIIYFTTHLLWQKLRPKSVDESVGRVLSCSHEFLENDLTKMARRLCEFGLFSGKKISSRLNAYLHINYAQTFLFDAALSPSEQSEEVERILSKRDWSERSPIVSLAIACLKRDYTQLSLLTRAAKDDGLSRTDALTYSVFREVREIPEFSDHFDLN